MALYSNRRDKDGTHIISGGGGNDASGNARGSSYPFSARPKSLQLDVDISEGIRRGKLHAGTRDNVFDMYGDANITDLSSIIVYLNGLTLDDSLYEINFADNLFKLKKTIMHTDNELELRSMEERGDFSIVDDVLILEVTPGLIEYEDLVHYTPSYGDAVNLTRISAFEENKNNVEFIRVVMTTTQTAYALSHKICNNGIYAQIKVRG